MKKINIVHCLFFCFIFFHFFCLLFYFDILSFKLWSQVTYLNDNNHNVENIFTHAHDLRYALVLPIFLISEIINLDHDNIFTILCFLIIIICSFILSISLSKYYSNKSFIFFIISFTFLSFFMNGRLFFAFISSSLLIYFFSNISSGKCNLLREIICFILILLFSAVSTGVFMVNAFLLLLFIFINFFKFSFILKIIIISFVPFVITIFELYFLKNYLYYGSLFSMLSHGFGKILFVDTFILSLAILIFLLVSLVFIIVFRRINYYTFSLIIYSFCIVFGYSTFLACIPLVLFLLYKTISKLLNETYINIKSS